MQVKIIAPARLHFSLCDLGFASQYAYGGIGISIRKPSIEITANAHESGLILEGFAKEWQLDIEALITHIGTDIKFSGLSLTIASQLPPHSGFGSHTALRLGVIEAIGLLYNAEWEREKVIDLSGRGRTSGIGIQTYFDGGLAYDFGYQSKTPKHYPSSVSRQAPPVVTGPIISFPKNWKICLALPMGKTLSGAAEEQFFQDNTPLSEIDALRAIATVHHGILPSVREGDLMVLGDSLRRLHLCGLKAKELRNQSQQTNDLYTALKDHAFACGLSSLGPLIYAIVDAEDAGAIELFGTIAKAEGAAVYETTTVSEGREIYIT